MRQRRSVNGVWWRRCVGCSYLSVHCDDAHQGFLQVVPHTWGKKPTTFIKIQVTWMTRCKLETEIRFLKYLSPWSITWSLQQSLVQKRDITESVRIYRCEVEYTTVASHSSASFDVSTKWELTVMSPTGLWAAVLKPGVCNLTVAILVYWNQKKPYLDKKVELRWREGWSWPAMFSILIVSRCVVQSVNHTVALP